MANKNAIPPKEHQYKPGESGNLNGRPSLKPLIEALKKATNDKSDEAIEDAIDQLRKKAAKGELGAIQYFLDRFYGKPHQSTDITSDGERVDQTILVINSANSEDEA